MKRPFGSKKIAGLAATAALVAGAWIGHRLWITPQWSVYWSGFARVQPRDGFDGAEALQIASIYFSETFGDCGGPGSPALVNGRWVAPLKVEVTGAYHGDVTVDARTGAVSSSKGPAFSSYGSFRRKVLWGL